MNHFEHRQGTPVLGAFIDAQSWDETLHKLLIWAGRRESRYVCICNVHSVVTATRSPEFSKVVNEADMATCDGMPVAWYLRKNGFPQQERINGPDLMWHFCRKAEATGVPIFLYGSSDDTLRTLIDRLLKAFPKLVIAGSYSPPFRDLTAEEEESVKTMVENSGARVLFVSLGCPKQEVWMARMKDKIPAVMIGVGAAFDYHAGTIKRAPTWMQNNGLEWFYRLMSEPRRLWKRYLMTNALFVYYLLKQRQRPSQ